MPMGSIARRVDVEPAQAVVEAAEELDAFLGAEEGAEERIELFASLNDRLRRLDINAARLHPGD